MGEEEGEAPPIVVLEVDMHCDECVTKIKRCVKRCEGVEGVMIDKASNKLTVLGKLDPFILRDRVTTKIHREVEIVSPVNSVPNKEAAVAGGGSGGFCWFGWKKPASSVAVAAADELKDQVNSKEEALTVVLKTSLDCDGCIKRVKKILLKVKGVKEVYVDAERELVTVEGTMDVDSLSVHMKSKLKRRVEIVSVKMDDGDNSGDTNNVKDEKMKEGDGGGGAEILKVERVARRERTREKVGGGGGGSEEKKEMEGFSNDDSGELKVERFSNGERMKEKVGSGAKKIKMDCGGNNEMKVVRLASGSSSGEKKEMEGGGSHDEMRVERFYSGERMKEKAVGGGEWGEKKKEMEGDENGEMKVERFTSGERMKEKMLGGGKSGEKKKEMEGGCWGEMKVERALSIGERKKKGGVDGDRKERDGFNDEMNKDVLSGGFGKKKEKGGCSRKKKVWEDVSSSDEKEDLGGYEKRKEGYGGGEKREDKMMEKVGSGLRERRRHKYEWDKQGEEKMGFDRREEMEGDNGGKKKKDRDNGKDKKVGWSNGE